MVLQKPDYLDFKPKKKKKSFVYVILENDKGRIS